MSDRGECVRCVFNSPFPCQCAAGLDMPWVCCDGVECETMGNLCCRHGTFHILLVSQNENGRLLKVLNSTQRTHPWRFLRNWCKKETRKNTQNHVYNTEVLSVEYLNTRWLRLKWNFLVLSRVYIIWLACLSVLLYTNTPKYMCKLTHKIQIKLHYIRNCHLRDPERNQSTIIFA